MAYRVYSYTPVPAEAGDPGERVRVKVGPAQQRQPRTFLFDRLSQRPSELISLTLPRPLGIVFEEDKRNRRAVVAGIVPRSGAGQRAALARFDKRRRAEAALPGDVLRAVTCTNILWPAKNPFGAKLPQRHIVLFNADESWERVANALKQGDSSDGPVTLVLERDVHVT
jgi:hypothetical protein